MRVLITGAGGFIGRQVAAALAAAGHHVVLGVRPATSSAGPQNTDEVPCDFAQDRAPDAWLARLAGIDAVVNSVGILRERGADTFERVHVETPRALAEACVRSGIRQFIQVSALGHPADGEFIASKHRGNDALRALDLDWVILRPSVVYSPAVVAQPLTGLALIHLLGYPLTAPWLLLTFVLYVMAGACWLPVVRLQLRMRQLTEDAAASGRPLPAPYHRCFRLWFALGWPAFLGVVAIFALMVWKPALWAT